MEKKKVIKKKIDESTLRNVIYKKILEELNLKEHRGTFGFGDADGDRYYTRPNGRTNYRPYHDDSKMGKRALGIYKDIFTGERYKTYAPGEFSHGKGSLCYQVIKFMEKNFQLDSDLNPNGKIEWTEKELKAIKNIEDSLFELAMLSKEEGNKKRGYDGPEEESEEMNEEFDLDNFSETTPPDAFEYDDNESNEGDKFEMFTKFLKENDKAREVVEGCVDYVSRGLDRGRNQDMLLSSAADEIMTNCIDGFCEEYNTDMGLDYNEEKEFKEKLKRFILDNIADDMLPDDMRMNEEAIRSYIHNIAKKHKH